MPSVTPCRQTGFDRLDRARNGCIIAPGIGIPSCGRPFPAVPKTLRIWSLPRDASCYPNRLSSSRIEQAPAGGDVGYNDRSTHENRHLRRQREARQAPRKLGGRGRGKGGTGLFELLDAPGGNLRRAHPVGAGRPADQPHRAWHCGRAVLPTPSECVGAAGRDGQRPVRRSADSWRRPVPRTGDRSLGSGLRPPCPAHARIRHRTQGLGQRRAESTSKATCTRCERASRAPTHRRSRWWSPPWHL